MLATLALAGVTAWMAFETRRVAGRTEEEVQAVRAQAEAIQDQAAAAREEVELSRASLETPIRPVLVDVQRPTTRPEGLPQAEQEDALAWPGTAERRNVPMADSYAFETVDAIYLSVPLRNVGPGTALIRGIGLRWDEDALPGAGVPTMGVVPPGERTRIQFSVPKENQRPSLAEFQQRGTFGVDVAYTDVAGGQWTLTRAHVNLDRTVDRWFTSQIYLHHKRGERAGSIDWGDTVASSGPAWGFVQR